MSRRFHSPRGWDPRRAVGVRASPRGIALHACIVLPACGWPLLAGCGGDARVEFSAADALNAVAGQMAGTIEEYHGEVTAYDASRESAVIAAFVSRVRQDADDETALAEHTARFEAALRKIHTDREVEFVRRSAAMENVSVIREVSTGLQKLAIQSLGLQDEMKRYLESWITAARQSQASATARTGRKRSSVDAAEGSP